MGSDGDDDDGKELNLIMFYTSLVLKSGQRTHDCHSLINYCKLSRLAAGYCVC